MDLLSTTSKRLSGLFQGPKTSFQVISDLNLDHESQYLTFHIPVAAPFLILAGNIGRLIDYDQYLSFLIRRCNLHEKVFLVLGPLEFHGLGWMDGLQLAHKMEKDPITKGRLEVLYETRSEVPGTNITLLGCTLWSKIPEADAPAVLKKMPEFDEKDGILNWSIEKHNSEHKRDLKWLLDEVKNTQPTANPPTGGATLPPPSAAPKPETQLVVVTSFCPDLRECLDPWQVDAPWASAFGTNLLDNTQFSNVKTWISGATSRTHEFKKGNTTVFSNQRGREGEHVTGLLKDGMSDRQKAGLFDVMRVIKL
ncbi:hypothetical protein IQ07DRAFT_591117 [Pyrenochaeta sp. DS3sAY3a]|nr:hypothetical protein IQ07DRAFT_591117 [Pyrenochaeta sp. DS3sAY3a]